MPGVVVDGMDVFAVYEAAGEAIERAVRVGPSFLECKTYRYYGTRFSTTPGPIGPRRKRSTGGAAILWCSSGPGCWKRRASCRE